MKSFITIMAVTLTLLAANIEAQRLDSNKTIITSNAKGWQVIITPTLTTIHDTQSRVTLRYNHKPTAEARLISYVKTRREMSVIKINSIIQNIIAKDNQNSTKNRLTTNMKHPHHIF